MGFSGFANLSRISATLPLDELCLQIMRAEFDRDATDALLRQFIAQHPYARTWFNLRATVDGGPLATEALVYLQAFAAPMFRLEVVSASRQQAFLTSSELRMPADMLRAIYASASFDELLELLEEMPPSLQPFFEVLKACFEPVAVAPWPEMPAFAIQRREHASLVINHGPTRIVTDPMQLEYSWTSEFGAAPRSCQELASTVLLSHTHNDHYSLASMLAWETDATRVIAPRVVRPSLLASDVAADIASAGLACETPPWHAQVVDHDVTIDVLPFYGEQPTRTVARPYPDARNWGNCYRINTPTSSLLLLFDSGLDPAGNMVDAVAKSVAERGPIDIVMSCSLEFPEAVNPGLPLYLLMVPFEQLRALAKGKQSMTLGPQGIADVCQVAGATYFMPYAQGFVPPGTANTRELDHCAAIAEHLRRAGATTTVRSWNFGENLIIADL